MNIIEHFTIELNKDEATALKHFLGNRSRNSDKESGLTDIESRFLSELYDSLPFDEEEE